MFRHVLMGTLVCYASCFTQISTLPILKSRSVKYVCKIYNVNVIDIVDITRQVNNRPELLARDSLHPSGLMYGIWAKKMLDEWKI